MRKDREYYCDLDIDAVAARLAADPSTRLRSSELGDIISAIIYRCASERITADRLRAWLGEPDTVRPFNGSLIWEYDWIGFHGEYQYYSATPFVLQDGRVIGVERDGVVHCL